MLLQIYQSMGKNTREKEIKKKCNSAIVYFSVQYYFIHPQNKQNKISSFFFVLLFFSIVHRKLRKSKAKQFFFFYFEISSFTLYFFLFFLDGTKPILLKNFDSMNGSLHKEAPVYLHFEAFFIRLISFEIAMIHFYRKLYQLLVQLFGTKPQNKLRNSSYNSKQKETEKPPQREINNAILYAEWT